MKTRLSLRTSAAMLMALAAASAPLEAPSPARPARVVEDAPPPPPVLERPALPKPLVVPPRSELPTGTLPPTPRPPGPPVPAFVPVWGTPDPEVKKRRKAQRKARKKSRR